MFTIEVLALMSTSERKGLLLSLMRDNERYKAIVAIEEAMLQEQRKRLQLVKQLLERLK